MPRNMNAYPRRGVQKLESQHRARASHTGRRLCTSVVVPLRYLVGIRAARDGLCNGQGELGVYLTMVEAASNWKANHEDGNSALILAFFCMGDCIRDPAKGGPQ